MKEHTHEELLETLRAIDNQEKEVTDWEAKFIERNLKARTFSRKQKQIITEMSNRYLQ